jgi:aryl-alcohol dehydrogenase-like predicted oxidoreductase
MTDMDYRPLGRTGVQVSKLCLGTMMFGAWGSTDHDDSARIIHAPLDAGVNFVDTADVYSAGESEEIVGKALAGGRRDGVVLATKFFMPMGEDPNRRGASRRWIVQAVEDSLRRLGTDWIDLYQMHRPDPATDIDKTLGALTDLVQQGKVRYIGSSSFSAGQIVEAQWTARERNLARFRTEQPPYSLLVRGIELDVLPTAQRHGMGILTYSPLAGGWLSGRWTADATPTSPARQRLAARFDMSLPENQRKLEAVEQLAKVADDADLPLIELAIGFVVNHPAVTSAIIGPRTMEQLDSQLPAADVTLDEAVLDRIDEIVRSGVNLNPADTSYGEQVLEPASAGASFPPDRAGRGVCSVGSIRSRSLRPFCLRAPQEKGGKAFDDASLSCYAGQVPRPHEAAPCGDRRRSRSAAAGRGEHAGGAGVRGGRAGGRCRGRGAQGQRPSSGRRGRRHPHAAGRDR